MLTIVNTDFLVRTRIPRFFSDSQLPLIVRSRWPLQFQDEVEVRTSVELPDALKIGIPSIDQQHANLLQLLDRFRQGLTLGLTSEPVGDLIYAVGVGLIDHFRAEEEVMDRMDLPDTVAKAHVDDHGQILEDYVALQEHILTFPPTTVAEVIDRIENWIMTHIVAHDLTLRKFVVRQQTCLAELPA